MMEGQFTRDVTLGQLLDEAVKKYPDNEAVVYADRDYETWREFSDSGQGGQRPHGPWRQKGDKVAIWATNVPHWVTLQFAVARIGAILITVNINYKSSEIEYVSSSRGGEHIHHRWVPRHGLHQHDVRADT